MTTLLEALAIHLDARDVGYYAADTALPAAVTAISLAGFPPGNDTAVALTTYPGPAPDSRNAVEYPRLQVRVRAKDPRAALDLDRAVFAALQHTPGTTVTLTGWALTDCHALQSEAQPMGRDTNSRWEFSRNYQLTTEPLN